MSSITNFFPRPYEVMSSLLPWQPSSRVPRSSVQSVSYYYEESKQPSDRFVIKALADGRQECDYQYLHEQRKEIQEKLDLFTKKIQEEGIVEIQDIITFRTIEQRLKSIYPNGLEQLEALRSKVTAIHCAFDSFHGYPGRLKEGLELYPNIQDLVLTFSIGITNSDVQAISMLTQLQTLDLSDCNEVTDSWLKQLAALKSLQRLDVSHCKKISDAGLRHLHSLAQLQELNLKGCIKITMNAVQKSQIGIPKCKIFGPDHS